MTKFALSSWDTPERREGRTTQAFRLLWHVLCYLTAFAAVLVAYTILRG
jgi:hypothetical protein